MKYEELLERVTALELQALTREGEAAQRAHALEASEHAKRDLSRFKLGIDRSNDAIFLTAPDGTINYVNQAFEALYGFTAAEAIGKNPRILKSGLLTQESYARLWRTLLAKQVVQGEIINRARDGRLLHVESSVNPILDDDDAIIGFLTIHRDITQRKRDEEERARLVDQLRSSQKMEAIGSLAGGVAHDFNNLLSVILTYTTFAIEEGAASDSARDDLMQVQAAAERAAALTRQLLAFSRKQILQPVVLSLNQIVTGIDKMLRRILGEDIDLVHVLPPDLGLVRADPGQIEQVLMNLVVNARDAMPDGGKLTIETLNVEIDEAYAAQHQDATPGPHVLVSVTDTGRGMDEQTLARIFEPFFTTKELGKGTGLGLSTVYGILKQSGGSIAVLSEQGRGTTFSFFLPREVAASFAPAARPSSGLIRPTGNETILVVEDESALRKVAVRALEAAGYTVISAPDGPQALLACEQHVGDIRLLLTDVVMPKMNGRTLAEQLTRVRPTVKVLYMSGYIDDAILHHGVLDSGTHFLSKPFTAAVLARKVREVLDSADADPV
ncbi:MAG: PAS domain S-box protein [Deltaproteobacteria bacterium]